MIVDLETEAKKYGLKVHVGKTAILTNAAPRPPTVRCMGHDVRVLQQGESEKYLGRKFNLNTYHETELTHRVPA
eukprot:5507483-Pyramimonas_sp.AAC.1